MRTLYLSTLGAMLAAVSAPTLANGAGAPGPRVSAPAMPMGGGAGAHRWGSRIQGRWYGGARAPGGWAAYRRPVYGWSLPGYWINPGFYIANYTLYGLPAPRAGYGWSRYYDDAVLTDNNGRVYDSRSGIEWDRYGEDWNDAHNAPRPVASEKRDSGIGGAVIGGVVGGVAGNVIAGRGNRTVGTLVGAGVGAVAGAAIDKAEDRQRSAAPPRRDRYDIDHDDNGATYRGRYSGNYADAPPPPPPYRGPGVSYDAPPRGDGPHWAHHEDRIGGNDAPNVTTYTQPGYYAGGYYYPGVTTTTVVVQPAVTTTVEEVSYVTRRVAVRRKARAHCRCK